MRDYLSTQPPVSSFTQALGNSEWWNMTRIEDNVGFLGTGSGVQQFQLSLGECFVFTCRPFFPHLMSTNDTNPFRLGAKTRKES